MSEVALLQEVVRSVEAALCVAVCVVLARRRRRQPSAATTSALGVFAAVALVLVSGWVVPSDATSGWGAVAGDVLIVVLLSIPYLLVRFTHALGGLGDRTRTGMGALLVLEWVATVAAPPLPEEDASRPGWAVAYVVLVLAAWSVQSVTAAAGLWRAGRGQPSVVRGRMHALSAGAVLLAVTLVASGAAGADRESAVAAAITLVGLLSIVLFALAFLPPRWLRVLWRQPDVVALSAAERGLMAALTRDDVAGTIVPVVAQVLGGGAALLDVDGRPLRSVGLSDAHLGTAATLEAPTRDGSLLVAQLTSARLVVRAGQRAPVFGDEEVLLLERVGTLVDLALQRAALFEQEQAALRQAEVANRELETLLYSVSHDLRSPLISVLGYLDVVRQEHAQELTGDGPHYLERISVNAVYMQSLIADLLELSRIGRNDPAPQPLDLQRVAEQVVEAARLASPAAQLEVEGRFPVVLASDVRMRQLLTNLVDNALKHGGRDDLRVVVRCTEASDGRARLEVADDGRGIPAEHRERVLQVFERLDATRGSSGTGMGLAICKRIVESLGGTVTVEGPRPPAESGTTVVALLPADVVVPTVPGPRDGPPIPAPIEESA